MCPWIMKNALKMLLLHLLVSENTFIPWHRTELAKTCEKRALEIRTWGPDAPERRAHPSVPYHGTLIPGLYKNSDEDSTAYGNKIYRFLMLNSHWKLNRACQLRSVPQALLSVPPPNSKVRWNLSRERAFSTISLVFGTPYTWRLSWDLPYTLLGTRIEHVFSPDFFIRGCTLPAF